MPASISSIGQSLIRLTFGIVASTISLTVTTAPFERVAAVEELPQRCLLKLGTERFAMRSLAGDLAFSPDETLIAVAESASSARMVRLFDVATGEERLVLTDPDGKRGAVTSLAFSPDGAYLLCGQRDGRVILWELSTATTRAQRQSHDAEVTSVAFSSDGAWWASAGADGLVELRSATDAGSRGRILQSGNRSGRGSVRPNGDAPVVSVVFTPDSQRLIVASRRRIAFITIKDGTQVPAEQFAKPDPTNPLFHSVTSSNRDHFLAAGRRHLPRGDTGLGDSAPDSVSVSILQLRNAYDGSLVRELSGDDSYGIGYATLSPDGDRVVVAEFSRLVSRDAATGKVLWHKDLPGFHGGRLAYSPDAHMVAMAMGRRVAILDAETGKDQFPAANQGTDVADVAWSPDGRAVATGHRDGFVRIWDSETGMLTWERELAPVRSRFGWTAAPDFVAFTADGSGVITGGWCDDPNRTSDGPSLTGVATCIDHATSEVRWSHWLDSGVRCGVVSPDGATIVLTTGLGSGSEIPQIPQTCEGLYAIDVATGDLQFAIAKGRPGPNLEGVAAIAFASDSSKFHIAAGNGEIVTFHATTGEELDRTLLEWRSPEQQQLKRPDTPRIWQADFGSRADILVSSFSEDLFAWDTSSRALNARWKMENSVGCFLAVAPDSTRCATADFRSFGDFGQDAVQVRDLDSGRLLLTLRTDGARARVLKFSPDGNRLFTGLSRGAAAIWDVSR